MSARKAWWLYASIRIGLFVAAFVLLHLLGVRGWLGALFAAVISAAISILVLDPVRQRAAQGLQDWKNRDRTDDDIAEDDIIEADPSVLNMRAPNNE